MPLQAQLAALEPELLGLSPEQAEGTQLSDRPPPLLPQPTSTTYTRTETHLSICARVFHVVCAACMSSHIIPGCDHTSLMLALLDNKPLIAVKPVVLA